MNRKVLFFCGFFLMAGVGQAEYRIGKKKPVKPTKSPAKQTLKELPVTAKPIKIDETPTLQILADHFRTHQMNLKYLRKLKYGYQDIVYGLIIQRESAVDVGRVLKEQSATKDWKKVSQYYFVEYSELKKEGDGIIQSLSETIPPALIFQHPYEKKK